MKIDIKKLERQIEFLKKEIAEDKAKGRERKYDEGALMAYESIAQGFYEEE